MMKLTQSTLPRRRKSGFSLVEMVIVIGLIALIGSLLLNNVGKFFGSAQEDIAKNFVENTLKAPLLKYRIDMGSYPTSEQGIKSLYTKPDNANASKWRGPYIEKIPADPWGNEYQYLYPGKKNTDGYDLWSKGPDANSEADDIGNW